MSLKARAVMYGLLISLCTALPIWGQGYRGPQPLPIPATNYSVKDAAFKGVIHLAVDATDTVHKVFVVHETIPVQHAGKMILLYPQWETGSHAATISVANLAGLEIWANPQNVTGRDLARRDLKRRNVARRDLERRDLARRRLEWRRDAVNPHAFEVVVPPNATELYLDFQYLSPPTPRAGAMVMTAEMVEVPWQNLVMYPAGWFARDIAMQASLRLPLDFVAASSLPVDKVGVERGIEFLPTSLETLVDSPVYAGRYVKHWDLAPGAPVPMRLDVVADSAEDLALSTTELERMRTMVSETQKLFGSMPFKHYDFLVSLSDQLPNDGGLEHRESSEVNLPADSFRQEHDHLNMKNLMAHELVHAWNGMAVTPADLWAPDLNTPMRDSLLWVYEGQTEYWALALAARAGQLNASEAIDILAMNAAAAEQRPGRAWKSLADSDNDPLYDAGHSVPWPDWQRREDYYGEGVLLWLDVDTKIQELSGNKRSLAEFTRSFFGSGKGEFAARTYTFADLCKALNRIAPLDWRSYLEARLNAHDERYLLNGISRAGYRLVYSDKPGEAFLQNEADDGVTDVTYSVGMKVAKSGIVKSVSWMGSAFKAGISIGTQIETVNDEAYSPERLLGAIEGSESNHWRMGVVRDGKKGSLSIAYQGKLAYPHLERVNATADLLSPWLAKHLE